MTEFEILTLRRLAEMGSWHRPLDVWNQRLLEMVEHLGPYSLAEVARNIRQDVMILVGAEDQFIPTDQVTQFQKALVNARSVTTKIYDRASGGHEHSQLGAPTLWHADFFDWIEEKFGAPESNKR